MPPSAGLDWEQLKMPLGFVRLLELVFCLIAYFALSGWEFDIKLTCTYKTTPSTMDMHLVTSSLRLDEYAMRPCVGSESLPLFPDAPNTRGGFYSTLLLASILISVASLIVYVRWGNSYASDDRLPTIDIIVTSILAFAWVVATLAFSLAVKQVKATTVPEVVEKQVLNGSWCKGEELTKCEVKTYAMTSLLSVAVVAGVACVLLYAVNVWFVYKETPSFKAKTLRGVQVQQQEPYTLE